MGKEFDIYKLGGREGKGSIRAVKNFQLRALINSFTSEMEYGFYTKLCKDLGLNHKTTWNYLNRVDHMPLYFLKEIEERFNLNLIGFIRYLEYGVGPNKRRVKLASLSEDFASFVGAFIADGHLRFRRCSWGNDHKVSHFELVFREEYKSNVDALANWINNVFDIGVKPRNEGNHYSIYISNKIVFRYFTKLLGFKSGRKTDTVTIPQIFLDSDIEIKRSILKGILMFDGSVSRKTGYIELYSKSRELVRQVSELLIEIGISPGYIKLDPDKYGRYRVIIRKRDELKKCLCLFEEGTEKHGRLKKVLGNI